MKLLSFSILFTLSTILTISCSYGQEEWSYEDRKQFAAQRSDTALWDMKIFHEDLESFKDKSWPIEAGISNYPSPVPDYDWGYCYLANLELVIDDKVIEGNSIGFAKGKYRPQLPSDSSDYYFNYFNIFILSDLTSDTISSNSVVSRNYPHYFSTGKTLTSHGAVDWMQLSLAGGDNIAVVSQRFFDLEFGKTILVAPLQDGSLRILQVDLEIGSLNFSDLTELDSSGTNKKVEYLDALKSRAEVVEFFGQGGE